MNPSNIKISPALILPVEKRRAEASIGDSFFLMEKLSNLLRPITGKIMATELLSIINTQLDTPEPDNLDLLIEHIQKYLHEGRLFFLLM